MVCAQALTCWPFAERHDWAYSAVPNASGAAFNRSLPLGARSLDFIGARPDWVPQWIWEKYLDLRNKESLVRLPESSIEKLDKLMADRRCGLVWKTVTRRRGTEFKEYRAARGLPPPGDSDWDDMEVLLCRIPVLAAGLLDEDKVTRAERARQGVKVAQAATMLRTALEEARISDGWPRPLSAAFANQALAVGEAGRYGEMRGWEKVVFYDPDAALHVLHGALSALGPAAEAWSSWRSAVARPKDPNAARLRFVREMTELFRRMYGSPLREPVAALVSVLFDCDMDANTVAKLDRERTGRSKSSFME
jgi:hypothetical protein